MEREGIKISIEQGTYSFYQDGEVVARMGAHGFTKQREWRILAQRILDGDQDSRERLCEKLLIQRKYLDKIGRKPPYQTKELLEEIRHGKIDKTKLGDFFSLWNLH